MANRLNNIWDAITGKEPNPLDKYLVKLLAGTAIYPTAKDETYLNSYLSNNDVFTIINKITEPASTVPVYQYDSEGEIVEGKMIERLNNPNNYQDRSQFIEAALTNYYLYGNSYTAYETFEGGLNAGLPARLDQLPPKLIQVIMGTVFDPVAGYSFYPYSGSSFIDYPKDKIFHWKEFNPDYDYEGGHLKGMSRLRPLIRSIIGSEEAYNSLVKAFQAQGMWGLLTMLDEQDVAKNLNKEQKSILKSRFKEDSKKGDLTILNSKVEYTKMGLTIVELEVLQSLSLYKGNICDALNVPSQLLSGSQDRTYNNFKEAEAALWRNAIQPSLDAYLSGLSSWLAPLFKEEGTFLRADYSNVSCLQANMAELVSWMVASRSFTKNEIRAAVGYEEIDLPEMDMILESAGYLPLGMLAEPPEMGMTEEILKRLKIGDYREK